MTSEVNRKDVCCGVIVYRLVWRWIGSAGFCLSSKLCVTENSFSVNVSAICFILPRVMWVA